MGEENKRINRRTFLKATGIGGASIALSAGLGNRVQASDLQVNSDSQTMPKRLLGKTGVTVPILALGGITDWTVNQALLKVAINMGVTYWDTANGYSNGKSEIGIGQYFEKYPEDRKKIFLVSKATNAENTKEMTERLNTSLERMKTDCLDLYFMHGPRDTGLLTKEVKEWSEQKKREGKIKFFGFSSHANMDKFLIHASNLGWIDVIMLTYNYRNMNDDDMKRGVDACSKANVGLVAMKVMAMQSRRGSDSALETDVIQHFIDKGFTLEQAKLKAVWQDERIASSCVAMYSMTILKDNVAAATDGKKLSGRDLEKLHMLAENTRDCYCIGCMKCSSVMGAESSIPDVMRYMMYYNSYGDRDLARESFRGLPDSVKRDLANRDYSPAEALCPQHIRIGMAMREAVRILV